MLRRAVVPSRQYTTACLVWRLILLTFTYWANASHSARFSSVRTSSPRAVPRLDYTSDVAGPFLQDDVALAPWL